MAFAMRLLAAIVAGVMAATVAGPAWTQTLEQIFNDVAVDGTAIAPGGDPVPVVAGSIIATGEASSAVINTSGPCGSIAVGPNQVIEVSPDLLSGADCTLVAVNDGLANWALLIPLGVVPLAVIDFSGGDGDGEDERDAASK